MSTDWIKRKVAYEEDNWMNYLFVLSPEHFLFAHLLDYESSGEFVFMETLFDLLLRRQMSAKDDAKNHQIDQFFIAKINTLTIQERDIGEAGEMAKGSSKIMISLLELLTLLSMTDRLSDELQKTALFDGTNATFCGMRKRAVAAGQTMLKEPNGFPRIEIATIERMVRQLSIKNYSHIEDESLYKINENSRIFLAETISRYRQLHGESESDSMATQERVREHLSRILQFIPMNPCCS